MPGIDQTRLPDKGSYFATKKGPQLKGFSVIREQNLTTNIGVSGLSPMHNLTEKSQAESYMLFQVTSSTQHLQVPHH